MIINYRVADMDAVVAALQSEGIEILGREDYDYGRFAWIMDPEEQDRVVGAAETRRKALGFRFKG